VSIRSFSLNDPEAYDIICRRRAPADRNPRGDAPVKVEPRSSVRGTE